MFSLKINGLEQKVDVAPDTPLLWVLRDILQLTGTKFGCGKGLCGACTVHLDGNPVRSCSLPVSAVGSTAITTIEGLSAAGLAAEGLTANDGYLHPVQEAWIELDVPQCGYCQPGQIMSASALLKRNPHPTDNDIDNAMSGNICRCGTYPRIRKAIHRAAKMIENQSGSKADQNADQNAQADHGSNTQSKPAQEQTINDLVTER